MNAELAQMVPVSGWIERCTLGIDGFCLWPPERRLSAHADVFSRHLDAILSWVGLETPDMQTPYAVDVTGGSRNSAMSRKISANKFLGIATSVI
ncbi:MAG: hypothetical protein WA231_18015 [Methylocella sp.]